MSATAFEEGNPLDRAVYFGLILLLGLVLMGRHLDWGSVSARNATLILIIVLALVSTLWSDFPFITAKRWLRDLGNYLCVLVVLSDDYPTEAVKSVIRNLSFILVTLSVLLNKYFLDISRKYDQYTGSFEYDGVATGKNLLAMICMISALFFLWDITDRWSKRKRPRARNVILLDLFFLGLSLQVQYVAHSTTAHVCFALGSLVMLMFQVRKVREYTKAYKVLIPALFILYLVLDFGLGMNGSMAQAVGKDPSLTDRTHIWAFLLGMHTNPLIGTGYQSFWLGPRLMDFWNNAGLGRINEAHNGYLETYLEEGLIGLSVLVLFLAATYKTICRRVDRRMELGLFGLATWLVFVFYNMSEAANEGGYLFLVFLMASVQMPASRARKDATRPTRANVGSRLEPKLAGHLR